MKLTPTSEKFILHWGEMGTRWGVNRTVSQIHALLYLSPKPLCAEEIANCLNIARSNVSTSIRELQSFNIIKVVHVLGDRRDHFETEHDIWEMFINIIETRKRREIEPTLATLRQCMLEAEEDKELDPVSKERIKTMHDFIFNMSSWYERMIKLKKGVLQSLMNMGEKIAKFAK
ncbi:GbsR/MarR family transcriptional regulator [Pleionea sp. CnH1-48]|uniref:GbsR/MarR family transcriptional regulator n=1 Tax=Pleionea sp. CnH1-48 TaxID=2954494 RepID=UPI002097B05C|nr:ArsR family transcriptional regulator [Pleionea sp. CnH1-48]MCO7226473.1 ArsR family transcriptional regulator [Pleionea sp. CnH1-48]